MLNFEIEYIDSKRVKIFDCITALPIMVRKPAEWEFDWLPCEDYIMEIEGYNQTFHYSKEKDTFYVDHNDKDKQAKLSEEHAKATEWMTDIEAKEWLSGKAINFYKRTPYILIAWKESLNEIVKEYINKFSL